MKRLKDVEMKRIISIVEIVEKARQKNIKKIVRRLNKMSPSDVATLARIIKA